MGSYIKEDEKGIDKLREEMANEIVSKFLNDMKSIGIDEDGAIKIISERGE